MKIDTKNGERHCSREILSGFSKIPESVKSRPVNIVLSKICSEKMRQTDRRKPMPKCDFNKVAKHLL